MRSNKVQGGINNMTRFFYRFGFWHKGPAISSKELSTKIFYCFLYLQFPISLMGGAITNDSIGESIFLVESAVTSTVLFVKLCFLIWKQNEIEDFLDEVCRFSIRYDEDCIRVDVKLKKFVTFVRVMVILSFVAGVVECMLIPIVTSGKYLFYEIAFPWDWRTNDVAYWAAVIFLFIEMLITMVAFLFSVITWYLLLNCSLRYQVLGNELKKLGSKCDGKLEAKAAAQEVEIIFSGDLKTSIDHHLQIRKSIDRLESFCFNLFSLQFCTSGLCICTSIYSLAFDVSSNTAERFCHVYNLTYHIAEIFMITFFGNEIMVSSDRLSYCLFESAFVDRLVLLKKRIIIFTEWLKQPHQLMVAKLYPLTLETFTRILNGAYSMFNILKSGVQ